MIKRIHLDARRMKDRQAVYDYFSEVFDFPEYFGKNLDALYDCLSEVSEPTEIEITQNNYAQITHDAFARRVWRVIQQACKENPYLHCVYVL